MLKQNILLSLGYNLNLKSIYTRGFNTGILHKINRNHKLNKRNILPPYAEIETKYKHSIKNQK